MDILKSLLTFTMFWKLSWSMECYACDPEHTSKACSKFDYSSKYVVQCEHSTMCFKRISTLEFSDGLTSHSIERGCAQQTLNGEQKKINGKWRAVQDIHEVYDETCSEDPSNAERSTKTLHCYCRGDKCNGAQKALRSILTLFVMTVGLYALS